MKNTPIKYTGMALLFCFVGCVVNAEMLNKPTGEVVLQALLNAGDIELSNEPLCNMSSASMDKPNLVLSDHLATITIITTHITGGPCNEPDKLLPSDRDPSSCLSGA